MISEKKAKAALKEVAERQAQFHKDVRSEFRKQALTAITAALALIIALSWREPIELSVKAFIAWLGITTDGIWPKVISAVVITIIAALALVILARWANKTEEKKPGEKK
jgi:hypothetical protein